MTERKAQPDPNDPPEDVASLYSWANLHGAKYRDFSASRAQTREKARQRVEQVIEEERLKVRQESEAQRAAESARAEEEKRRMDPSAPQSQPGQAAPDQSPRAPQPPYTSPEQPAVRQPPKFELKPEPRYESRAESRPETRAEFHSDPRPEPRPDSRFERPAAPPAPPHHPQPDYAAREVRPPAPDPYAPPPQRPAANPAPPPPMREESYMPPRILRGGSSSREENPRPAWLMPERPEPAASAPPPPIAPDESLQSSRDRLASRWFALQGIFEGGSTPPAQSAPAAPAAARAPVLAVFSLAGGVGKTSIVATLGRALSGRGERVLLVDTAAFGLLPFFFGARDQRPGFLRTFSPPPSSGDAPIQMITLDPETMGPESATQESLSTEISKYARGVGRVIIDLPTASGSVARRIMRMSPQILVPLVPDMSSVVSVSSIDAFFQHHNGVPANPTPPQYLLNQFDSSLPLHLDVREILREQLGDRLLPFALRQTPTVSEALAEGMTIMDYAPNSTVTDDYSSLAAWVKSFSAPAASTFRGVRWSER
jgi:cellulose synthase operon protein YhjQ